jgi:hypothetical protein
MAAGESLSLVRHEAHQWNEGNLLGLYEAGHEPLEHSFRWMQPGVKELPLKGTGKARDGLQEAGLSLNDARVSQRSDERPRGNRPPPTEHPAHPQIGTGVSGVASACNAPRESSGYERRAVATVVVPFKVPGCFLSHG